MGFWSGGGGADCQNGQAGTARQVRKETARFNWRGLSSRTATLGGSEQEETVGHHPSISKIEGPERRDTSRHKFPVQVTPENLNSCARKTK